MSIGQRIIIVGSSGSGKTSLAKAISVRCQIPHIELDSLFWKSNWQESADDEFFSKIQVALENAGDSWVLDGNYSRAQSIIWPLADTIIWLDYPLWLSFARLLRRTLRRMFTREMLWGNNRESVREVFFSKESILLYSLKTHKTRRQKYLKRMLSNDDPHLNYIRLCHPREATWITEQID